MLYLSAYLAVDVISTRKSFNSSSQSEIFIDPRYDHAFLLFDDSRTSDGYPAIRIEEAAVHSRLTLQLIPANTPRLARRSHAVSWSCLVAVSVCKICWMAADAGTDGCSACSVAKTWTAHTACTCKVLTYRYSLCPAGAMFGCGEKLYVHFCKQPSSIHSTGHPAVEQRKHTCLPIPPLTRLLSQLPRLVRRRQRPLTRQCNLQPGIRIQMDRKA